MISRRNIRVKVMQTLYTVSTLQTDVKPGEPQKLLQRHFDQSKDLLQYFIYFISEVAAYAEKDSYSRRSKHLPSAEDLNVNTKIAGNELLWRMREDPSLKEEWARAKPELRIDKELVRKIYLQLQENEVYKQYIATPTRDKKSEKEILDLIFEDLMLPHEDFIAHLEEMYSNW